MNDIDNAISRLEKQRSAIDRALSALREIAGLSTPNRRVASQPKPRKKRLSPEGRRRIIEATRKRWAAIRAKETGTTPKRAVARSRRRGALSAEGRKRLALAMKKRWAAAKKAGKKQLA